MVQCRSFSWRSKNGVLLHLEEHVEIARGSAVAAGLAFAGQPQAIAIVHAGRNVDLELALHLAVAVAVALGAGIADDLAGAVAGAAGAADGEEALLVEDFAAAVAGGAGAGSAAGFAAGTLAAFAAFHARHLDFGAHAEHGVLEADFEIVADVFAALRAGALAAAAPAASEQVAEAEEIAEDVAEIGEGFGIEAAGPPAPCTPGMAEAIVGGALLRIAQDAIGLARLLEFLFGRGIVRIAIGMVALGEFAVSAFNLLIAGSLADTQNFVIISLRHGIHCVLRPDRDLNHRGPEKFSFEIISSLELAKNGLVFGILGLDTLDSLMQVGVEFLVRRFRWARARSS